MRSIVLVIAILTSSCSGPLTLFCRDKGDAPYTTERPTVPFHITVGNNRGIDSWNSDGAPTVLAVHNPTDRYVQAHVQCWPSVPRTYIDYGHHEWITCLGPHQEKERFVEFMNVDAIGPVCSVDHYVQTSNNFCNQHDE